MKQFGLVVHFICKLKFEMNFGFDKITYAGTMKAWLFDDAMRLLGSKL